MTLFELKELIGSFGLEYFNRYYASYSGTVSSNVDPDNLGRLQLFVPSIYGETAYKYWAMPKGLYSGAGTGFFFIPNKGDKVWVSFENGDPRYPIWEYGSWGAGDVPAGAKPETKILMTATGHTIELNDKAGSERILIKDKSGNEITLDANGTSIKSDNISLGKYKTSKEKAALGETLKKKIEDLCDKVSDLATKCAAITVLGSPTGVPSAPPINAAAISAVGSAVNSLKASLSAILSEHVTLD